MGDGGECEKAGKYESTGDTGDTGEYCLSGERGGRGGAERRLSCDLLLENCVEATEVFRRLACRRGLFGVSGGGTFSTGVDEGNDAEEKFSKCRSCSLTPLSSPSLGACEACMAESCVSCSVGFPSPILGIWSCCVCVRC